MLDKKRDTLKAGQGLATDLATGGVMTAPVVAVVNASDGNSYWGLSNGRILKRTSGGLEPSLHRSRWRINRNGRMGK